MRRDEIRFSELGGGDGLPGYTVITRIMSAAFPMSSVTAVDGVSGEMATPAFIPRFWIFSISGRGAAEEKGRIVWLRINLGFR